MRLWEGGKGLEFVADIPQRRLRTVRQTAGFVSGVSFKAIQGRYAKRTERATGCPVRVVYEWEKLRDITLLSSPAFKGTRWEVVQVRGN